MFRKPKKSPDHPVYHEIPASDEREPQRFVAKCHACDADLTPVFVNPNFPDDHLYSGQFENALHIRFRGGYAMFIESSWLGGPSADDLVICHDCAHKLCALVPWIRRLLDPENSHTHTKEYRDAHPAHYGWDYDEEKGLHAPAAETLA